MKTAKPKIVFGLYSYDNKFKSGSVYILTRAILKRVNRWEFHKHFRWYKGRIKPVVFL